MRTKKRSAGPAPWVPVSPDLRPVRYRVYVAVPGDGRRLAGRYRDAAGANGFALGLVAAYCRGVVVEVRGPNGARRYAR